MEEAASPEHGSATTPVRLTTTAAQKIRDALQMVEDHEKALRDERVREQTDILIELIVRAFEESMASPLQKHEFKPHVYKHMPGPCNLEAVFANESVREIIQALIDAHFDICFYYHDELVIHVNVKERAFSLAHCNGGYAEWNFYEIQSSFSDGVETSVFRFNPYVRPPSSPDSSSS